MRELGKGHSALDTFSRVMNTTTKSHSAYDGLFAKLHSASLFMAKESMAQGGIEVKEEVDSNTIVSIDGTWYRRRHSSHNGLVAVISGVTGKVLDFEVLQYVTTVGCVNRIQIVTTAVQEIMLAVQV